MQAPSLRIDRTFAGVGRVARFSGTRDRAVLKKINKALTTLYEDGRLDLLRALRDDVFSPLELYDAFRRRALDALPTGETARPLGDAFRAWLDRTTYSPSHRRSLGLSLGYLERVAGGTARIADLPARLLALRRTLGAEHPPSFKLARSAALAFLRATLTRAHPLYLATQAVEPARSVKRRKPHPLTVPEMRDLFPAPATDPLDAVAWAMATTGMHQAELWGAWSVLADRVHIDGTKRAGRKRDVPLAVRPAVPTITRRQFETHLLDRTRLVQPYDLRRSYSNWMEAARIPRTRRRLYMGHGSGDVTDLYEFHEVEKYLLEDAELLRQHIGDAGETGLQLVKGA